MDKLKSLTRVPWQMFFCLLFLVFSAFGAETMSLEGIIEAAAEDAEGNATAIQLSVEEISEDGEIIIHLYSISKIGKGKELLANVGENVKLSGLVKTNKNGSKAITVNEFEVLSTPAGDEYPEDDYTGEDEE